MPVAALLILGLAILVILLARREAGARRPPCGSYGDLDGDGWVTEKDADLLQNYFFKNVEAGHPANLDGDGFVDMQDVSVMAAYLRGDINTFPVCGR